MWNFVASATLLLVCLQSVTAQDEYQTAFRAFKQRFGKTYADAAEEETRFAVFKGNYIFINAENAKGVNTYELGVNEFSDLTVDQFGSMYFGYKPSQDGHYLLGVHEYQGEALAASMDWRTSGAVTPVKNQGQCGSCWSFSTTGALEGAWKVASGQLVSLSEEEFVQCDTGSNGCQGGSMVQAFGWAESQGLCTESSYQYTSGGGTRGSCHKSGCQIGIPSGGVTGYKSVAQSAQALMSALNQQPVSIAVEADKSVFQSYRSGIMNGACGTQLDHGILAIGYGTDAGTDYWLVKNSWGSAWGEQGFGKLLRGKNSAGECGILMQASYPVVAKTPGPGPAPGPSPGPAPGPSPGPATSHYEKPPCQSDEVEVQIQGLTGVTCSPKCTSTACPTDVPAGTTAKPQCALQDSSSGDKYCALECLFGGCPTGATCQHSGLMGICMYPQSDNDKHLHVVIADTDEYHTAFRNFKKRFGRTYKDAAEEEAKFAVFKRNLIFIETENAKNENAYELGVNDFSDLTLEEFSSTHFGYKSESPGDFLVGRHEYRGEALATSMDWRTSGAVTPVKNQGQCGSCWSFSTTGALEGAWKIASGQLVSLSEEEFVQCDTGSNGCGGGSMQQAFGWAKTQGLCTEDSYKYTSGGGVRGTCHQSGCQIGIPSGGVTGYTSVGQNEQALMSALNQQPVSIAVEADKSVFQSYRSGIMDGACGTQLDHGILAVGYGTDSGKDYWLVKNSWGSAWGEQGFGKLLRGKNSAGECGILMQASYPVVSKTAVLTV